MHQFIFGKRTIIHTIAAVILLCPQATALGAATSVYYGTDSTSRDTSNTPIRYIHPNVSRFVQSRWFQSTHIGIPLIISGLVVKRQDDQFRSLRNDFMPHFHRTVDNYTQYAPAAILLGLKAAGVESRSSWGRMLISDAFSAAIMGTTVNILKTTTHVMRPDGSDRHSFPSGHTATAFMTATMLSKEYGYLSPWVSVGAYSIATATGLMRMANNKHWLSDVITGAGIGILSSEFGYWIADEICKGKGLQRKSQPDLFSGDESSSFLGLYMGYNLPLSKYDLNENLSFKTSSGTTIGLEGAGFINPYIGFGGKASISNLRFIVNGSEAPDDTFDFYSLSIGPYFSLPLSERLSLGTKLLLDHTWYTNTRISSTIILRNNGWGFGTGLSVNRQFEDHFGASLFLDYDLRSPHGLSSKEYLHILTLGARACIRF
ncbi:MAG: phosphatase PAP2 family protein [Prevotella sp.]|jgi:hypothetical protein|nr:phosphatase PAP2 family protein [Prevotella sp.]MCI1803217.1 phosphatase PAP2 family protein [Prevotella sp.]MCI1816868.1 phosphatase PAP2 family protein [Prevotella sp.]MCI1847637.1 phosphatase PAP2 family protein [Prevotella sp.]MCI2151359.1 phosphatase PAP2 family protein [Prevotella sp.]